MRRAVLPLLVLSAIWFAAGTALMLFPKEERLDLVHRARFVPVGFDDRTAGRRSEARVSTRDSSTLWEWVLDPAPGNSYVGVLFERVDHTLFDGSRWDSLRITWGSDRGTPVRITIQTDQPGLTVPDRPLTRRYLQVEAVPPLARAAQSWALSDFRPPPWWFRENKLPLSESRQFLDRCVGIALENGETAQPGSTDRVRIAALEFVKTRPSSIPAITLWILGSLCVLGSVLLLRISRSSVAPLATTSQTLHPVPLDAPPVRAEIVRSWLQGHYHESGASIEGLARELALGPDATSKEIRKHFQDTFKGMVNRLRLQEARRLLSESDLGIAEIAFKVGYGSVPHFNRLAKEAWGRTPTEERAAARGDAAPS